ncbi:MAG: hypothetical protein R2880_04845 [Deinococcales bacterium]
MAAMLANSKFQAFVIIIIVVLGLKMYNKDVKKRGCTARISGSGCTAKAKKPNSSANESYFVE